MRAFLISSRRYLLLNFRIAELLLRITGGDRKSHLLNARTSLEKFLKLVDSFDLLPPSDSKLLETYQEGPNVFSTASTRDAASRRETKIARFREEKALKQKLEVRICPNLGTSLIGTLHSIYSRIRQRYRMMTAL